MKKWKAVLVALIFIAQAIVFTTGLKAQTVKDPCEQKQSNNRKPVPYTHLREADVMWSKRIWRIIDLREKINQPLHYPLQPVNCMRSMFQVLKDGLRAGTLTAYSSPLLDDEFNVPMSLSEVERMFVSTDTVWVDILEGTGEKVPQPVKNELESEDIIQYWLKEDWVFDKQKSVMEVRILGIAPLRKNTGEDGEVRGYQPLFWVYFPAVRPQFAVAEVFNRFNDAERRTLDDIFWKRQFNSYIRKESNVYDRVIAEYKTGLDALLESERVKDDLFTFEHDVWHF